MSRLDRQQQDCVYKTNRLAGKLFKAAGILAMLGAAFPEHAVLFILVPVILAGIYPLIYSYQEYQREMIARASS